MAYEGVSSIFALRFGIDQSSAMTKGAAVTVPIDGFPAVDGNGVRHVLEVVHLRIIGG